MNFKTLALIFAVSASQIAYSEEIKIGAILPLSGDFAFAGEGFKEGIEEAVKEYPHIPFKVIYEDDQSLNKLKTVAAFQKLSSIDDVPVVLSTAVNSTAPVAPIANKDKLATLIIWDANDQIKKMGASIFGIGIVTEGTGQDVARAIVQDRGKKKIAILSVQDEWSQVISEAFENEAKSLGAEIVLNENFSLGEKDFRSTLKKAISKGADAIYYPVFADSMIAITRQARELQFKGDLVTGDSMSENEINALGDLAEGVICAQVWLGNEEYKDVTTAIHKGFAHLGKRAIHMTALVVDTLNATGKAVNRENIHQEFTSLLKGTSEVRAKLSSSDGTKEFKETVLQISKGKLRPISSFRNN